MATKWLITINIISNKQNLLFVRYLKLEKHQSPKRWVKRTSVLKFLFFMYLTQILNIWCIEAETCTKHKFKTKVFNTLYCTFFKNLCLTIKLLTLSIGGGGSFWPSFSATVYIFLFLNIFRFFAMFQNKHKNCV